MGLMIEDAMYAYQKHDREMVDSLMTAIESIGASGSP